MGVDVLMTVLREIAHRLSVVESGEGSDASTTI